MPTVVNEQAPVPPPANHRAQGRTESALQVDALTLVTMLHLLALCRLAVRLAHRHCPPPLPAGPGGADQMSETGRGTGLPDGLLAVCSSGGGGPDPAILTSQATTHDRPSAKPSADPAPARQPGSQRSRAAATHPWRCPLLRRRSA